MKNTIPILLFLSTLLSFGQEQLIQNQLKVIVEKKGDLDNDGIDEKVVIYETKDSTDSGYIRELCISKIRKGAWTEWKKTRNAVRNSREGGPMGDPLEDIQIKNGVLSISFYGGGNRKWTYTDTYKFQNNQFQLIHYISSNFKLCDYWDSVEFNLLSGKIIAKNGYEKCKNKDQKTDTMEIETFYKKGIVITLQNRKEKKVKIITPKKGRILYLW